LGIPATCAEAGICGGVGESGHGGLRRQTAEAMSARQRPAHPRIRGPQVLNMDWRARIVCDPDILVAKPSVKGARGGRSS
jgi:hypothetical protein